MSIALDAAIAPPRVRAASWERAGAALCLAQCSEPFFNAVAQSQGLDTAPGYARLAWIPVYLFLAFAVVRDWRAAGTAVRLSPLLAALLGFAFVSALWSIDAAATVRRGVWLALTMLFGLYLAWRYRWRDLFEVFAATWAVLIAGSAALAILAPQIGVMAQEHPGAWAGLWTHKNTLGGIMALGAPIGCAAALATGKRRYFVLALAAFAMVLASTSKTSLLASLLGAGIVFAGVLARRGPISTLIVATAAAAAAIVATAVLTLAPELAVGFIGRDLTFTGRTDIWSAAEGAVAARPWLGYGYGAFWIDARGPAFWVREAVQWNVPSAHNGWLELALGVGRIGIALFALHYLGVVARAARALADPVAGLWAPAFCAVFALYTMSESHILEANNLFWTLYVAMSARLAFDAHARKSA